jgi:hypothetical protein
MNFFLRYDKKTGVLLPFLFSFSFLFLLAISQPLSASDWSKEEKVTAANIGGIAAITAWGVANWDYFGSSPKKADEGWFSKDTSEGGADKCAHFYFSYTLSHILAGTFDYWSYSREKAALLGAVSSFGLMGYMEFGDAFSSYGFSHEDFAMNMLGCAAGYLLYKYPAIAKKIDFRMEYIPRFDNADLVTDYEHMKFLMAVKLAGFKTFKKSRARPFELQIGYYARGYPHEPDRERAIYIGVGISLPDLFSRFSMNKTARFFNYYQLPYTYVSADRDLN